jgi:ABC-type dipeptide/oligopeptide/nickel transport system permease subunit
MGAQIPKKIKEFVPSDILDDGPQAVLTIAVGAIFGAWITAKGHSIHWFSGWPLGFLIAIVVSLVAWVWRSRVTDRKAKEKDERQETAFSKIDETHEATIETRDIMREIWKTTSASGVAEAAPPGLGIANVTAKASVEFGGTKPVDQKEKDQGA